jgi:hypothetical protein
MKVVCEVNKIERSEKEPTYYHTGRPLLEITEDEYNKILEGRKK